MENQKSLQNQIFLVWLCNFLFYFMIYLRVLYELVTEIRAWSKYLG